MTVINNLAAGETHSSSSGTSFHLWKENRHRVSTLRQNKRRSKSPNPRLHETPLAHLTHYPTVWRLICSRKCNQSAILLRFFIFCFVLKTIIIFYFIVYKVTHTHAHTYVTIHVFVQLQFKHEASFTQDLAAPQSAAGLNTFPFVCVSHVHWHLSVVVGKQDKKQQIVSHITLKRNTSHTDGCHRLFTQTKHLNFTSKPRILSKRPHRVVLIKYKC